MPAVLMKGAPLAARIRADVATGRRRARARRPGDGARRRRSRVAHLRRPQAQGRARGGHREPRPPAVAAETTADELRELIEQLNADDDVDGILVQLPLPKQLDGRPPRVSCHRRRTSTASIRSAPASSTSGTRRSFRRRRPGCMELLDEHERRARGPSRRRRRPQPDRRQADGAPAARARTRP